MTVDRLDILINRVVDREASPEDWAELESLAERDPSLWRRLADAEREHATLAAGVEDAIACADRAEIPHHAVDAAHRFQIRLRAWGGWAVAAILGLAWATAQGVLPTVLNSGGHQAGLTPVHLSPDEAFEHYMESGMEEGRVLAELPTVMIDARQVEGSEMYEITVIRRIIERTRVNGAYGVEVDDGGEVRVAPVDVPRVNGDST